MSMTDGFASSFLYTPSSDIIIDATTAGAWRLLGLFLGAVTNAGENFLIQETRKRQIDASASLGSWMISCSEENLPNL